MVNHRLQATVRVTLSKHGFRVIAVSVLFWASALLQSLALQDIVGSVARSPGFVLLPLALLLLPWNAWYADSRAKWYFGYVFAALVASLLMLLFYLGNHTSIYQNRDLAVGTFTTHFGLVLMFMAFVTARWLVTQQSGGLFLACCEIAFWFETAVGFWQLVHKDEGRIALTFNEPSEAGFAYVLLGLATYLRYEKSPSIGSARRISFLVAFATVTVTVLSKGALVALFFSLIFAGIGRKRALILGGLGAMAIGWVVWTIVIPELMTDIEEFTSFSTRYTFNVMALHSLFAFPIGQGAGTYRFYSIELLTGHLITYISPLPIFNSAEVDDIIATGVNLSVKSFLLQEVVKYGALALAFYCAAFIAAWKAIRNVAGLGPSIVGGVTVLFIFIDAGLFTNAETGYLAVAMMTFLMYAWKPSVPTHFPALPHRITSRCAT